VGKIKTRVAEPRNSQVPQTETTLTDIGREKGRIMSGRYFYNLLIFLLKMVEAATITLPFKSKT